MDAQTLFNIATGCAGALAMWVLTGIKESLAALHKSDMELSAKLNTVEVLVAGTYVKRDELERLGASLLTKLDKIDAKLDTKADKATCDQMHFAKGARHE